MEAPPSKLVVLRAVRTTAREYDGTLADGRRIYARCKDGQWVVRVGERGEDAIAGEEVAAGTTAAPFTYRELRRVTRERVVWPPRLAHEEPGTEATIIRAVIPAGSSVVQIAEELDATP